MKRTLRIALALPLAACLVASTFSLPGGAPILIWSTVCLLALFLIVKPAMLNVERRGWFVAIFTVFSVGYFWSTARSYSALTKGWDWTEEYGEFAGISESVVAATFPFICGAFLILIVLAGFFFWLTPNPASARRGLPVAARVKSTGTHRAIFAALMAFAIFILATKIYFGIGIMGLDLVQLPYYLDKVLNRLHSISTIFMLFFYWRLDDARDRGAARIALVCIVTFLVASGLYSGSRSSFIQSASSFGLLWYFSGRLTKHRIAIVIALVVATIFYFPVASALRIERISGSVKSTGDLISVARESSSMKPGDIGDISSDVSRKVLDRFVGAAGLWQAFRGTAGGDGIEWRMMWEHLILRRTVSSVFTNEVVGVQVQNDFRSPGVLGFLWLLGGYYSLLLWAIMVFFYFISWEWFSRMSIRPVAQSAGFGFTLFSANEGTYLIQDIATFYVILWIIELLNRRGLTHQDAPPVH